MGKLRRFKLRNGMIVEECNDTPFMSHHHNYKVISSPFNIEERGDLKKHKKYFYVCLLADEEDDAATACGGSLGHGFDIVEEVL